MEQNQANLLQGTLDLLVLKAIGDAEFHGLGIARRVEQITRETFAVRPGSLFPALHRMEEAGWLTSSWGESETNAAPNITGEQEPASVSSESKRNNGRRSPAPSATL